MTEIPYPRAEWRLIVDAEPRTGAWNMALDEAILEAVASAAVPPTLRFYQWEPPSLSLGKRQPLEGIDLARCRRDGVDVVRRPTGGWAILHTGEWTYSVAAPQDDPRTAGPILDAYRQLSAGLVAGLRRLGANVAMNPVDPQGVHNLSAACFEVPSAYEITVGGKKLIGSAQTRPLGRVLQHGSLPLQGDIARVADYLWFESEAEREALRTHLAERATTLGAALGRPVGFAETCRAMREGFGEALNLALAPGEPTQAELAAAAERAPAVMVGELAARGKRDREDAEAMGDQSMGEKLRVGIIFGGRSGEHEVSIASAASVMEAIDKEKYEVVPIGITHEGRWLAGVNPRALTAGATMDERAEGVTAVAITGDPTLRGLVPAPTTASGGSGSNRPLDVVIPVLHGTYGEDGTLQGLLEMAGVAYAGCGVLGSALGMDKEKAKLVFKAAGLPVVDWLTVRRVEFDRDAEGLCDRVEARFTYPIFVKPANLGSSVGVSKAHDRAELRAALATALEFDRKAVVEPGVNARELECGVLGNDEPQASIVGEVVSSNEFYDYRAKYIDNASRLYIPAPISDELTAEVRRLAAAAFRALDLSGLARVDFFLDRDTDALYVNEVNTMPGFTQISMYPKLWEASGVPYPQLLDRLIELALERHADRQRTRTSYSPAD